MHAPTKPLDIQQMVSYDLDTSIMRRFPLYGIVSISRSPIAVGKYIYVIGKGCEEQADEFYHGHCKR